VLTMGSQQLQGVPQHLHDLDRLLRRSWEMFDFPRADRGLTQQELAATADISREYLGRLEAAKHDPTLTVLERRPRHSA
jgi:hypothetical protein